MIGERCSLGQNVVVMNGTRIGNNVKIQNNVSIYEGVELEDDVFCGPSMVFTNVMNPRSHVSRKNEYRQDAREARRHHRRQCDDRLRHDARRVCVHRRGRGRGEGRAGVRADGRRAGAADRMDVPVWRAAAGQRRRARAPCVARPTSRATAMFVNSRGPNLEPRA